MVLANSQIIAEPQNNDDPQNNDWPETSYIHRNKLQDAVRAISYPLVRSKKETQYNDVFKLVPPP